MGCARSMMKGQEQENEYEYIDSNTEYYYYKKCSTLSQEYQTVLVNYKKLYDKVYLTREGEMCDNEQDNEQFTKYIRNKENALKEDLLANFDKLLVYVQVLKTENEELKSDITIKNNYIAYQKKQSYKPNDEYISMSSLHYL